MTSPLRRAGHAVLCDLRLKHENGTSAQKGFQEEQTVSVKFWEPDVRMHTYITRTVGALTFLEGSTPSVVAMAGWLHGVFVGDWLFVFPLCGFSLSLFCNYPQRHSFVTIPPACLVARVCHIYIIAGARFALRCWLCSASADVVMRRVYGALLVATLVVCCVCAESGRV